MQEIQKSQIQIFNGKWLFNYLAYETIEYIIQQKNKRKNQTEITLLTKDLTNQAKETINLLVKEYKRVNIVTNNIGKFKYLENKIYNDYGVMITITNNKRKSLAKAEIIVNFDFSENMINTFNIKEDAIIINIAENIKIQKKRFNGICINNYELYSTRINDEFEFNKIKNFYIRDILEENLYRKDTFANIRKDITSKHYKIKELFGNNGKVFF